jgi:mannose-6-phosphate isomerase-like protein (cupin superfamily)
MNRREFLAIGSGVTVAEFPFSSVLLSRDALKSNQVSQPKTDRRPVIVRAGFTRRANGTEEPTTSQQTVVRSFDSEGRLAAFVVPIGQHEPYRGAPLHVHHEQDEWLHILAGEFVAEVGGQRFRLKLGGAATLRCHPSLYTRRPHGYFLGPQPERQRPANSRTAQGGIREIWNDPSRHPADERRNRPDHLISGLNRVRLHCSAIVTGSMRPAKPSCPK